MSPKTPLEEPMAHEIEELLAEFRSLFSEEDLDQFREELEYGLREHPAGIALVRASRVRTASLKSEELETTPTPTAVIPMGVSRKRVGTDE